MCCPQAGKNYELLNCDNHMGLIRKYKKDIKDCRPDILHQCLLMLQDSPLNQAGLLQVIEGEFCQGREEMEGGEGEV